MNIFKKICCLTIAVAVFSATATGAFAATLGREETRVYSKNVNVSLQSNNTLVTASDVELPFDAGSVKVAYTSASATGDKIVRLTANGTIVASAELYSGNGQVEFAITSDTGIKAGSTIGFRSGDVSATITSLTFYKENSPGEDYYQIDLDSNISLTQQGEANGKTVETYFPFDVGSLEITYTNTGSAANVYASVNGVAAPSYVVLPVGSGTKRIYFSSSIAPTNAILKLWKQTAGNVTITGIKLYKENKIFPDTLDVEIEYTDYEEALQTASIFKNGSNIYKSKNAIRYMSYDNTDSAAFTSGSNLYVPVDAIALALSLYKEETSSGYLFRASDNSEFTISKAACLQNTAGDWCYSVKAVAEAFGYTANAYSDYLIIDKYKVRANEIIGDQTILNGLISEFGSYEAAEVAGNTWYVSANAATGGNGSEASPFKTIQEAANRATAGDRVIIKGGTYRETVTPANFGTAKNPIIFEAASGEQVTVSAFEEIKGFKLYYDGIYVAKLPTELDFGSDFIMYGEDVLVEGRQPNTNTSGILYPSNVTSPLWHTKGRITTPNSSLTAESSTELSNGRDSALRNSTYVGFKGYAWEMAYGKVISSFKGRATVQDLNQMNYFGKSGVLDWGYLTNSKMTLDKPGEWYAKKGVLYIIPPSGVSPNQLKVEAKQRYTTFDLTGKSCIQLKNINTIGGSILMGEGSELNIVNGGTHKYTSHFTYPFDENGVSFESFENFVKGKSGNYVGGKNNAIVNTCIDTGAGGGIILGGRHGYVAGNTILDTSYSGLMGFAGILLASSVDESIVNSGGHNIHFNTVCKTGRAALGNRTRHINDDSANERIPFIASEISYNDFSYSNILARDSGIIYLHGCSMGNDLVKSEIHHNVLSNSAFNGVNKDGLTLAGAYADNYTANGIFHDNIVYYEGDFVYNKNSYDPSQMDGDELYIGNATIVQEFGRWGRTYSTFEAYANKGVLHPTSGFNKTNTSNFPSGKIFKYGA